MVRTRERYAGGYILLLCVAAAALTVIGHEAAAQGTFFRTAQNRRYRNRACNWCAAEDPRLAIQEAHAKGGPFFPVAHHWRWSYVNGDMEMVVWPQFKAARPFSEGLAAVQVEGRWGYEDGRLRVWSYMEAPYRGDMPEFPGGEVVSHRWGYVNEDFEFVIAPLYEVAKEFGEGMAYVVKDGRSFYIDAEGEEVFACNLSHLEAPGRTGVSEGTVVFRRDGLFGFLNVRGDVIIEPVYEDAWKFSDGLARVRRDGLYGFVNRGGEEVIAVRYERAGDFNEGHAPVCDGGRWGLINTDGDLVVGHDYGYIDRFSEGVAPAMTGDWGEGRFGFINAEGEWVIEPRFYWARPFSNGRAIVSRCSEEGGGTALQVPHIIDETGAILATAHYDFAGDFNEHGLAVAGQRPNSSRIGYNTWCVYLDRQGRMLWAFTALRR